MSTITKNTSEYVNEKGKFKKGNKGKPKGATNKTTRDVREFITNFLNDKSFEIPHIWNSLEDKDKATLYLHLCRLVLPRPTDNKDLSNNINILNIDPLDDENTSKRPIIQFSSDKDLTPIEKQNLIKKLQSDETNNDEFIDLMQRMTIDDLRELVKRESLTTEQIDLLIEKL